VEVKFATPVGSSEAVPRFVEPTAKMTVPVGTVEPELDAATAVATSSTGKPCVEEAVDVVRASVLPSNGAATITFFALDVEGA
jgi:hypothetical protein